MTHGHSAGMPGFVSLAAMWLVMMTLMMAPTVWPWVRAAHIFGSRATFFSGYVVAWLLYSMAAAALQMQITPNVYVGAALLVGAGLFQFSALKRACLTHCRNPLSYFLTRWRNGPGSGFRIGFGHGVFCVGCCWAMMATALAAGVMNLWWMGVLALAAFAEQTLPYGDRFRAPVGVALIAVGIMTAFR